MLKKHVIPFVVLFLLMAPVTVFAILSWIEKESTALPVYKSVTRKIADFNLTNQFGQTVSLKNWQGKIVVADFFFTHCPVICPKMTTNVKKIKAAFPNQNYLLFTSFTVDPARDSVAQLRKYAKRFGITGDWHLLTGDKATIYKLARKSFAIAAAEIDGGEADFIHSDKLVLLDARQHIRGYYSGTADTAIQRLITDIKKLHDEK